jgi:hypothetical protein
MVVVDLVAAFGLGVNQRRRLGGGKQGQHWEQEREQNCCLASEMHGNPLFLDEDAEHSQPPAGWSTLPITASTLGIPWVISENLPHVTPLACVNIGLMDRTYFAVGEIEGLIRRFVHGPSRLNCNRQVLILESVTSRK